MTFSTTTTSTTIGATCTNMAGGVVTITVPQAGSVVIHAQVWYFIDHTNGVMDSWRLNLGTSATDCPSNPTPWVWSESIAAQGYTNFGESYSALLQRTVSVAGGTYSFYLNGYMSLGQNANDDFIYANMVAVFYPS